MTAGEVIVAEDLAMDAEPTITDLVCGIVGYERLEELCTKLGGLRWSIPRHPPRDLRDARIRQEFGRLMVLKGSAPTQRVYDALATKYGIHERHVRRIVDHHAESDI